MMSNAISALPLGFSPQFVVMSSKLLDKASPRCQPHLRWNDFLELRLRKHTQLRSTKRTEVEFSHLNFCLRVH